MDGMTDGWMHTWMDEGHFYRPPPPTSGDKNMKIIALILNLMLFFSFIFQFSIYSLPSAKKKMKIKKTGQSAAIKIATCIHPGISIFHSKTKANIMIQK